MFSDALKSLRIKKELTQEQLANALGVGKSAISMYESGNRTPDFELVEAIADFFNVSIDYLIGRKSMASPKIANDTVTFPIIGEIAAGYERIAAEDWTGDTVEIPASYLKGRSKNDFFVLSVCGDSMYPHYQNGDIVLILKQQAYESGDICAVIYDGECATLKKVEKISDGVKLVPVNPEYMPRTITGGDCEKVVILGVPRLLIRNV